MMIVPHKAWPGLSVGWSSDARFCHQCGHIGVRRHIKRGIGNVNPDGRDRGSADVVTSAGIALFYGNKLAGWEGEIDS